LRLGRVWRSKLRGFCPHMSNKFGWEKANARDAARRAGDQFSKMRRRKPKAKRQAPSTFTRYECPRCCSLRTVQVIGAGFRCDDCQFTKKEFTPIQVRRIGKTMFARI
jgi:hypothetical protein